MSNRSTPPAPAARCTRLLRRWAVAGVVLLSVPVRPAPAQEPPSARAAMEASVDTLLARMTLDEKLGQLTQYSWAFATGPQDEGYDAQMQQRELVRQGRVGSFLNLFGAEETRALQQLAVEESRLGIPLLFAMDVIHGYRTIFPVPLAEASSWDLEAVERSARVAAVEAAAVGLHWTFAPMVDIARDARWGRIVEGAGEDPYLGAAVAAARVRGFQGDDLAADSTVLACAKHMAAYGGAEGGRDYNTVDLSERTLREIHLPPFHAAVEAGVATLMSAFNEIGGIPATASRFLFTEVLREEWGFDGFVVSDWTSVAELMAHGVAATPADAGLLALEAGVDMDMMSGIYPGLAEQVRAGRLSEALVDASVRRVLRAKYRLGLFEDPYRYSRPEREAQQILSPAHLAAARDVARRSIVLLKNEPQVLPLARDLGTLAVIGPLADDQASPLGPWAAQGRPEDAVTVLDGIRGAVSPQTQVLYARGSDVEGDDRSGFAEAVRAAEQADAVVLVLGEHRDMSAEAASRASIDLPGVQQELARAVHATGKPVVVVLMNGRPLAIPWLAEHVPALLETWFLGVQTGPALADVLFGDYNPSGKLPVTFPRATGQIPIYYNHKNTGRPPDEAQKYTSKYLDLPSSPLFPFGHGLSYTRFAYEDLEVSPGTAQAGDTVTARLRVRNTGERAGKETVQLYVRDDVRSVTPPVQELKGFAQVALAPGEAQTVTFRMPVDLLGFYDAALQYVVEPGRVEVRVGSSSADIRLTGAFEIGGAVMAVAYRPRFTTATVTPE